MRLRKHLEKKTVEVIFDELTKDQILDGKNFSLDKDGAIVESADGVGDNGDSDRGINVEYTNQLIMNTYKSVDFCKHSCDGKDCKSKENLNVFEMLQ